MRREQRNMSLCKISTFKVKRENWYVWAGQESFRAARIV